MKVLSLGRGRSLEEGMAPDLQYFCLRELKDREAWPIVLGSQRVKDMTEATLTCNLRAFLVKVAHRSASLASQDEVRGWLEKCRISGPHARPTESGMDMLKGPSVSF